MALTPSRAWISLRLNLASASVFAFFEDLFS